MLNSKKKLYYHLCPEPVVSITKPFVMLTFSSRLENLHINNNDNKKNNFFFNNKGQSVPYKEFNMIRYKNLQINFT